MVGFVSGGGWSFFFFGKLIGKRGSYDDDDDDDTEVVPQSFLQRGQEMRGRLILVSFLMKFYWGGDRTKY